MTLFKVSFTRIISILLHDIAFQIFSSFKTNFTQTSSRISPSTHNTTEFNSPLPLKMKPSQTSAIKTSRFHLQSPLTSRLTLSHLFKSLLSVIKISHSVMAKQFLSQPFFSSKSLFRILIFQS
jgi:hypothetical protein